MFFFSEVNEWFHFWNFQNEALVNLEKAKKLYMQKQQELEKVCNEVRF